MLTEEQIARFEKDGMLVLRSFYDLERDIVPIQYDIYRIIGLLIDMYEIPVRHLPFSPETFDAGYQDLIAFDRKIGGEVYDAVKQIPAFLRLVCSERHDRLFAQLRGTDMPGVAAAGYGIRIDHPFEEQFRADWHQDYMSQFRSLDGIVFWSPPGARGRGVRASAVLHRLA